MDDNKLLTLAEHIAKMKKQVQELSTKAQTIEKTPGPAGKDGKDGMNGKDGINGKDGRDGIDGKDGKDGADGQDGISIVDAKLDFDDSLVFTLSDGTIINVGDVKGEKGEKGEQGLRGAPGISSAVAGGFYNIDGGLYNSIYGGTTPLDAGGP